jgi:PKD domain
MKNITIQMFVIMLSFCGINSNLFSQKNVNGRLVFSSIEEYDKVYLQLSEEVDKTNVEEPDEIKEGTFYDPMPTLANFEKKLGFRSLRVADLQSEIDQLMKGAEPENIKTSWISDPVSAALVNSNFEIQIGKEIHILKSAKTRLRITDGNERTLEQIRRGGEITTLIGKGVEIDQRGGTTKGNGDPCEGFSAKFQYPATLLISNSGQFVYNGSPATSYFWTFGDNTTSTLKDPTHTFPGQGLYVVMVTATNSSGCVSTYTFPAVAVNQGCNADFSYNKGNDNGQICFDNESDATTGIVSYLWDFGDGSPKSTESDPCHTYTCDKEYNVTLTITSASGCKRNTDKKVTVSSYACCDNDIDESEDVESWEYKNKHKLVTHANTFHPWIGSKADHVNAEIRHYRRVAYVWWLKKPDFDLKVSITGNMYGPNQTGCSCEFKYNVDCSDSGTKSRLKAKKSLPQNDAFKTAVSDPWKVDNFKSGTNFRTYEAPAACD